MVTNNAANYRPTQYNVQSGGASGTLNNVAPSATSGVPLISQGVASQPVFGQVSIAGGGTNATSFGTSSGIVVYNGTSLVNYSGPKLSAAGVQTNTSQPSFYGYFTTNSTNATGDGTLFKVPYNGELYDNASNYDTTTYTFTAPVAGNYFFSAAVEFSSLGVSHTTIQLFLNISSTYYAGNNLIYKCITTTNPFTAVYAAGSMMVKMAASDTVSVNAQVSGGTKTVTVGPNSAFFTATLLC